MLHSFAIYIYTFMIVVHVFSVHVYTPDASCLWSGIIMAALSRLFQAISPYEIQHY